MPKLEDVFGVSSRPVLSYVERSEVDDNFREALASGKQIIVYGSSKQGKTALVTKYLPYKENILVSLTPKFSLLDLYKTILNQAGVRVAATSSERQATESSLAVGAKVKATLPLFGAAGASTEGNTKAGSSREQQFEEVTANIELPQTVADLLSRDGSKKWVVLENFHYLPDEVQQEFAFDLRAFQELGVLFVILGVWREKNRMAQFNGDLLDRVIEVPVEPWSEADFHRVANRGSEELNVTFNEKLITDTVQASFSSIGVFQELLRQICISSGVRETVREELTVSDDGCLQSAVATKTGDYAARHQRALEAIAAGHASGGAKGDLAPLFLPYYLVKTILQHGFDGISNGVRRNTIHDWIREIHHRGNDVRGSDMTNLLEGLSKLQSAKSISPPIFAYDAQQRMVQVVDSTFYFFIKNADTKEVVESIQDPLQER